MNLAGPYARQFDPPSQEARDFARSTLQKLYQKEEPQQAAPLPPDPAPRVEYVPVPFVTGFQPLSTAQPQPQPLYMTRPRTAGARVRPIALDRHLNSRTSGLEKVDRSFSGQEYKNARRQLTESMLAVERHALASEQSSNQYTLVRPMSAPSAFSRSGFSAVPPPDPVKEAAKIRKQHRPIALTETHIGLDNNGQSLRGTTSASGLSRTITYTPTNGASESMTLGHNSGRITTTTYIPMNQPNPSQHKLSIVRVQEPTNQLDSRVTSAEWHQGLETHVHHRSTRSKSRKGHSKDKTIVHSWDLEKTSSRSRNNGHGCAICSSSRSGQGGRSTKKNHTNRGSGHQQKALCPLCYPEYSDVGTSGALLCSVCFPGEAAEPYSDANVANDFDDDNYDRSSRYSGSQYSGNRRTKQQESKHCALHRHHKCYIEAGHTHCPRCKVVLGANYEEWEGW